MTGGRHIMPPCLHITPAGINIAPVDFENVPKGIEYIPMCIKIVYRSYLHLYRAHTWATGMGQRNLKHSNGYKDYRSYLLKSTSLLWYRKDSNGI